MLGPETERFPLMFIVPFRSRLELGVIVPIPTIPETVKKFVEGLYFNELFALRG